MKKGSAAALLLIAVILLASCGGAETPATAVPVTAAPTTAAPTTAVPLRVGERVTFGRYEQDNDLNNGAEPIEWMVMGVFDDYVDLISLYVLDVVPFHDQYEAVAYSGSSVNQYLNGTFFRSAFSEDDRPYMMTHNIPARGNPQYPGTDQGWEVTEYVYLSAINKIVEFLPTVIARCCAGTAYAAARGLHVNEAGFSPWWTRTMGADSFHAVIVRSSGEVDYEGWNVTGADYYDIGIRPAVRVRPDAPLGRK